MSPLGGDFVAVGRTDVRWEEALLPLGGALRRWEEALLPLGLCGLAFAIK